MKTFPKIDKVIYSGFSDRSRELVTKAILWVTAWTVLFPGANIVHGGAPLCINAYANEVRETVNGHFSWVNLWWWAQAVCPSGTRSINIWCTVTTGHVSWVLNGEIRVTPSIDSITPAWDCRTESNDWLTTDQDDFDNRNSWWTTPSHSSHTSGHPGYDRWHSNGVF